MARFQNTNACAVALPVAELATKMVAGRVKLEA
jgi:NifU-like protein involved in Fe-S cluster formation